MKPDPDDPYARLSYRRVVAWPERLLREKPLLTEVLAGAPERSLLDLGSGTGEHPWTLAELSPALATHGLAIEERWGGMRKEPYRPEESADLVLLARRL